MSDGFDQTREHSSPLASCPARIGVNRSRGLFSSPLILRLPARGGAKAGVSGPVHNGNADSAASSGAASFAEVC